jgi:hypothetical protein
MKYLICLLTVVIGFVCYADEDDPSSDNQKPSQEKVMAVQIVPATGATVMGDSLVDSQCATCNAKSRKQGDLAEETVPAKTGSKSRVEVPPANVKPTK